MSVFIEKNFSSLANTLKTEYGNIFSSPKEATERRFCWDYWHVPEQYTLLRTPAWEFFSENLYSKWEEEILSFARRKLGCHGITPPWLSCYVEGCGQELHADVPHGPWAYVYSLTNWAEKTFTGGETQILKDTTLDFWRHFESMDGVNLPDLVEKIPPEFNQLLVFDPRKPHGVKEIRGEKNPLNARLVIHGWLTDPAPVVEGGLEGSEEIVIENINELLEKLAPIFDESDSVHGYLALRMHLTPHGHVDVVETEINTLKDLSMSEQDKAVIVKFTEGCKTLRFPAAPLPSKILLPILFRF